MSPRSKCKKLKGLIIEVNVIGQIELILNLKESEEKNPHEIKIAHIFQIIESKILEARLSLSVKFFFAEQFSTFDVNASNIKRPDNKAEPYVCSARQ